eukprot:1741580-Prymnesium_polylepis.1
MADLRAEIARTGLVPIASGAGSGPGGKVQKADLIRQLAPFCQPPAGKGRGAAAAGGAPAEETCEEVDEEWRLEKIIGRRIANDGEEDAEGNPYPPGIILWHVQWEPIDGQPAEKTWEAEWQVEGAQPAVHEFMGSQRAPA